MAPPSTGQILVQLFSYFVILATVVSVSTTVIAVVSLITSRPIPSDVARFCAETPDCAVGELLKKVDGCAACVPDVVTLSSAGGDISMVASGTEPLAVLGLSSNSSMLTIAGGTTAASFALATRLRGLCSDSLPACAINERIFFNGTCYSCLGLPIGNSFLCGTCNPAQILVLGVNGTCYDCVDTVASRDLCGACSVGQTLTLGVNGTCYDCVTPAVVSQTPLTSAAGNVSIVSNSTQHITKALNPAGLVTLNDSATNIIVGVTPLTAPAATVGAQLFPTQAPFEIVSDSTQRRLFPAPLQAAMPTPVVVLTFNTYTFFMQRLTYRHEKINSNDLVGIGYPPGGTVIRTYISVLANIGVSGSGVFSLSLTDTTTIFGPKTTAGDTVNVVAGAGSLACFPTGGDIAFGAVYPQTGDQIYMEGTTSVLAPTSFSCQAHWTVETYVY